MTDNKPTFEHIVVAMYGDAFGESQEGLAGVYKVVSRGHNPIPWRIALAKAAAEFLETDDAQAILAETCGEYNFGDVSLHLPQKYLKKYGIVSIEAVYGVEIINHDANFPGDY